MQDVQVVRLRSGLSGLEFMQDWISWICGDFCGAIGNCIAAERISWACHSLPYRHKVLRFRI